METRILQGIYWGYNSCLARRPPLSSLLRVLSAGIVALGFWAFAAGESTWYDLS